jgi:hypothetical protein
MKKRDEWKIAFCIKYGNFEYSIMPHGLTNAPSIFQYMINDIFLEHLDHFVVIYLDDILIHSKNEEKNEHHVCLVLENYNNKDFMPN